MQNKHVIGRAFFRRSSIDSSTKEPLLLTMMASMSVDSASSAEFQHILLPIVESFVPV